MPEKTIKKVNWEIKNWETNEAVIVSNTVQYVGIAGKTNSYNGSLRTTLHYLRFNYLWQNIRVLGGAYGAKIVIDKWKNLTISSYRDPRLKETLETFKNIPNHLQKEVLTTNEVNKYITGALAGYEMNKDNTPKMRAFRRIDGYLIGVLGETSGECSLNKSHIINSNLHNSYV